MKTKVNGIKVANLTKAKVGNGLPHFVREAAETRGYGDALAVLRELYIHEGDIGEAFDCASRATR